MAMAIIVERFLFELRFEFEDTLGDHRVSRFQPLLDLDLAPGPTVPFTPNCLRLTHKNIFSSHQEDRFFGNAVFQRGRFHVHRHSRKHTRFNKPPLLSMVTRAFTVLVFVKKVAERYDIFLSLVGIRPRTQ
jgi:hypothetical protein